MSEGGAPGRDMTFPETSPSLPGRVRIVALVKEDDHIR